jgi:signal transduction histidine kinase
VYENRQRAPNLWRKDAPAQQSLPASHGTQLALQLTHSPGVDAVDVHSLSYHQLDLMTNASLTPTFFRRFAHDLANDLAGVRGALEILASRAAEGSDAEFARAAIIDLERAAALIYSAATYAAPWPLETRRIELSRVIDEALHQIEHAAHSSGVRINVARRPSVCVEADITQLAQALAEIVRNAAEAGAPTIEVRVTERLEDHTAVIEVTDTAPTTRPVDARAFEPLYTTKRGHAGLGLSIAKQVVEAQGGSIDIGESGIGTTVRITLPLGASESIDTPTRPESS